MNELKRELSKLSGVDFFNPKFRDVFKKYFPDEHDAEEERLDELGITDEEANEFEDDSMQLDFNDDNELDNEDEEKTEQSEIEDGQQDVEDKDSSQDTSHETFEQTNETDENVEEELLNTKIELELVKGGVRADKLNAAKRLAKYEIRSLDDLSKIHEIIKDYPEWLKNYQVKSFGMSVDETSDNLTEEEKRLKQMGIDPKE